MICSRCGRENIFAREPRPSAAGEARLAPPPLPPDVCLVCGLKDPELREQLRPWLNELKAWGDRRIQRHIQHLRALAVRPLEAIDRFIDSLR